jgi:hypothetical protein
MAVMKLFHSLHPSLPIIKMCRYYYINSSYSRWELCTLRAVNTLQTNYEVLRTLTWYLCPKLLIFVSITIFSAFYCVWILFEPSVL